MNRPSCRCSGCGAPEKDKRHVVYKSGHIPPQRQEIIKETLDWLDKYLGPTK
jgi:hypothetical protein